MEKCKSSFITIFIVEPVTNIRQLISYSFKKAIGYLSPIKKKFITSASIIESNILMLEVNRLYKARIARAQKWIPAALHILC